MENNKIEKLEEAMEKYFEKNNAVIENILTAIKALTTAVNTLNAVILKENE